MSVLCQRDVGTNLDVSVVQIDSLGVSTPFILDDVNDSVNFVFIFPSGARTLVAGIIVDGPNGLCRYTTTAGIISEFGSVKMQLQITTDSPSRTLCTKTVIIPVEKQL